MLTHGSLFAGIGGFDLGFERAGFESVWQVEQNEYCQKVLAKNFPKAKRYGDIRECGAHNLERVDIISGGFPCQDISNAGLRAGIEGERSGLWGEYARIIGELRPRFVLVENVAALLGRGMGRVLGDLSALGYDAEWQVISAADVGAPHLRERVWIVAYPEGIAKRSVLCADEPRGQRWGRSGDGSGEMADSARFLEGRQEQRAEWERIGEGGESVFAGSYAVLQHAQSEFAEFDVSEERAESRERQTRSQDAVSGGQWIVEPDVGRVAHGVPARVDRLKGLGNAIVPQIAEWIGRRVIEAMQYA